MMLGRGLELSQSCSMLYPQVATYCLPRLRLFLSIQVVHLLQLICCGYLPLSGIFLPLPTVCWGMNLFVMSSNHIQQQEGLQSTRISNSFVPGLLGSTVILVTIHSASCCPELFGCHKGWWFNQ